MNKAIENVKDEIHKILINRFNETEKREIDVYTTRLNFACPICGDSEKNTSKKRGNLYFRNMYFKCFNCGAVLPILDLFKKYNAHIDPQTHYEIATTIIESHQPKNDKPIQLKKYINMQDLISYTNDKPINEFGITQIVSIHEHPQVLKYLNNRNIYQYDCLYAAYSMTIRKPVVIIANSRNDYLLGMLIRNISKIKSERIFQTYTFENIWKVLYPQNDEIIDFSSYNAVSALFNILNISFYETITIFEGYFDSIFMPNSVALSGVTKNFSILDKDELKIRFFLDNDETGLTHSRYLLNKGYSVFLWNKLFKDLAKKHDNPSLIEGKLRKKFKDLNDLSCKIKKPYITLQLENFFSVDNFDKIYI